jgi:hypothetical protein
MSSKSSGLRNRDRRINGQRGGSTYARAGKAKDADGYGQWQNGECKTAEKIGRRLRNVDSVIVEVDAPVPAPRPKLVPCYPGTSLPAAVPQTRTRTRKAAA